MAFGKDRRARPSFSTSKVAHQSLKTRAGQSLHFLVPALVKAGFACVADSSTCATPRQKSVLKPGRV